MNQRNYEEEYSLLEIAKYNLKHWPILLICALVFGLLAGGYGFKNTEPSVVYYEELQQVNGAFFVSEYNNTSITERMYDVQQIALSQGTYERFIENTGYDMTYDEYTSMVSYSNYSVTSVLNMYIPYPESYGSVTISTGNEANGLMLELLDAQMQMYDEYLGTGAVKVLSEPYTTEFTQASANTATTTKDLVVATTEGAMAGIFLGILLGIIVVSIVYLIGTVAKSAKEIEEKLKAPALAFVHKNDKDEEMKKVYLYLEQKNPGHKSICYIPFEEQNAGGAYDLAKTFAKMEQKTLYVDLSASAKGGEHSLSAYLFGNEAKENVEIANEDGVDVVKRDASVEGQRELLAVKGLREYLAEMREKYDCVVVNAPEAKSSADAYGVATYCDKVVFGCKRRKVTGTDLFEIETTLQHNGMKVDGVVVYGN